MKHIITLATVNFSAEWGNKQLNLERIMGYIECAAKRGADLVLLPELALTGYDNDTEHAQPEEKMQRQLAETMPGETTELVGALTRKLGIYAVFGMPERDRSDPSKVYNAAGVFGPEGFIMSYRKRALVNDEAMWAVPGRSPITFDTPWGPVGIGICADAYDYPEYGRYASAMGARLFLCPTAMPATVDTAYPKGTIEALTATCTFYTVIADLYGLDLNNQMMGGSSIIGPANQRPDKRLWLHYYGGKPFDAPDAQESELVLATVDLSLVTRSNMNQMWNPKHMTWAPEELVELYQDVLDKRK